MLIKQLLDSQAKQLNSTGYDTGDKQYVLTEKEELRAIEHAVNSKKRHLAWRMANAGFQDGTIMQKVASVDWEKEIDRDHILQIANSNKLRLIEEQEEKELRKEAIRKRRVKLMEECTREYFLELMKRNCQEWFGEPFQIDEDNANLIRTVCCFLSRDKEFTSELNFDENKGLLIRGVSGLGKTFLFELVRENPLNPVKIVSMIDVAEVVKEEGAYRIEKGGETIIYLDDVGTEEVTVNHFGTRINWFKQFIEKAYTIKSTFKNIAISTNLSATELEELYGTRVRSRMREMFNVVDVKGKDRRK